MIILILIISLLSYYPNEVEIDRATYYNAVPEQTNTDCFKTASGEHIDTANVQRWVALSRDLLSRWGGQFSYGDTIIVETADTMLSGEWVVQDCMNARYKNSLDFLLPVGGYKIGVLTDVKIRKK